MGRQQRMAAASGWGSEAGWRRKGVALARQSSIAAGVVVGWWRGTLGDGRSRRTYPPQISIERVVRKLRACSAQHGPVTTPRVSSAHYNRAA